MKKISLFFLLASVICSVSTAYQKIPLPLKQLYIIAKQGNLPPSVSYPNDLNLDSRNWPNGLNNLDQYEKYLLQQLGKRLHGEYKSDLSSFDLEVRPTSQRLSIESAQLIHSGLNEANKRAIEKPSFSSDQLNTRKTSSNKFCYAALVELRESTNSIQSAKLLKEHDKLIEKLKENGGLIQPNLSHIAYLAKALDQEDQRGLKLPNWIDQSTRTQIRTLANKQQKLNYQKSIVRNSILAELLNDLRTDLLQATLEFQPNDVKKSILYVVDGSEFTALISVLDANQTQLPKTGAALVIEQYQDDRLKVRIFDGADVKQIQLPECHSTPEKLDCDAVAMLRSFNQILSQDWVEECQNSQKKSSLPYTKKEIHQVKHELNCNREQNQTTNLTRWFQQAPEIFDLLETLEEKIIKKFDRKLENLLNEIRNERHQPNLQANHASEQSKDQKQSLREQLSEYLEQKKQEDYEEIVDEWKSRTDDGKDENNNRRQRIEDVIVKAYEQSQHKKRKLRKDLTKFVRQLEKLEQQRKANKDVNQLQHIRIETDRLIEQFLEELRTSSETIIEITEYKDRTENPLLYNSNKPIQEREVRKRERLLQRLQQLTHKILSQLSNLNQKSNEKINVDTKELYKQLKEQWEDKIEDNQVQSELNVKNDKENMGKIFFNKLLDQSEHENHEENFDIEDDEENDDDAKILSLLLKLVDKKQQKKERQREEIKEWIGKILDKNKKPHSTEDVDQPNKPKILMRPNLQSVSELEVIEELDEEDDEKDEIEESSQDTSKDDLKKQRVNLFQQLLGKAVAYRVYKTQQARNVTRRLRDNWSQKRQQQRRRSEFEQRVNKLLDEQQNEQLKKFQQRLNQKFKEIGNSNQFVDELFEYLDRKPNRDPLVIEMKYRVLGELLRYVKESEKEDPMSDELPRLTNLVINRRRLRSLANLQADRLISELEPYGNITALSVEKSSKSDKLQANQAVNEAKNTSQLPLLAMSILDHADHRPAVNTWMMATIGVIVGSLALVGLLAVFRTKPNKRKHYIRM